MSVNRVATQNWTTYQVLALKFFTVFFAILIFPLDYKFYSYLFSGDWLDFHITDLLKIVSYLPAFFNELNTERLLGIDAFGSWALAIVLAAVAIVIWAQLEKRKKWLSDYDTIYYWLRVIVRYKLALILIAYGSIKVFPLQFPFPSLSNLLTNYGDFEAWKIWYHTLGVTPYYTAFLGWVEIFAGLLLIFRKTVTFGAALALGVNINVIFSSYSYYLGNQVLATFVFLTSLFILAHDFPRIFSLLYLERSTKGETYKPLINSQFKLVSRALFFVLASVIYLSALFNYETDPYLTPHKEGLKDSFGLYNVREFVINHDTIPYSRTDTNRWQNVVFEQWATISIKTAKPVLRDSSLYLTRKANDQDRVYESAGVDGRRYFSYSIDSSKGNLVLANKNSNHAAEHFTLHLKRPDEKTIILEGVNEKNDSIKAVLERLDRKFLLIETRRYPIEL